MKKIATLAVLGVCSGLIITLFVNFTKNETVLNKTSASKKLSTLDKKITSIFPDMTSKKSVENFENVYQIFKNDEFIGYAFKAEGKGFKDNIKLLAGVNNDFSKIVNIEILKQSETPGLGSKIEGSNFKNQFKGLNSSVEMGFVKDKSPEKDSDIQTITGATVSSKSVVNILNLAISNLRKKIIK